MSPSRREPCATTRSIARESLGRHHDLLAGRYDEALTVATPRLGELDVVMPARSGAAPRGTRAVMSRDLRDQPLADLPPRGARVATPFERGALADTFAGVLEQGS